MDQLGLRLGLSPKEYLLRFKDTLATVKLISRAPKRKLHATYHQVRNLIAGSSLLMPEGTMGEPSTQETTH